jgi:hypothetical protein
MITLPNEPVPLFMFFVMVGLNVTVPGVIATVPVVAFCQCPATETPSFAEDNLNVPFIVMSPFTSKSNKEAVNVVTVKLALE